MKIKQQGFTLIELMIVIVTIALLATIAYPSYAKYIRQTRLAAVRSELLQNARTLERYYTQKRTIKDFSNDSLVQNEYFDISLTRNDAAGFELKAEPNADKNPDENCIIHLSDSGIVWATNKDGTTDDCPGYEKLTNPTQP